MTRSSAPLAPSAMISALILIASSRKKTMRMSRWACDHRMRLGPDI